MFYNARWYDPALGRFAQADSIVPPGVQGLDRYAYVNNNPMRYTDPTGHCPWCIAVGVGAVAGAAIGYGTQVYNNYQDGVTGTDAFTTNISAEPIVNGAFIGAGVVLGVGLIAAAPILAAPAAAAGAACVDGDCTNELVTVGGTATKAVNAACADGDCTNEAIAVPQTFQRAIEAAKQNGQKITVLGRFQERLPQFAKQVGGDHLQVDPYNWGRNVKYIADAIRNGNLIVTRPDIALDEVSRTSIFYKEIQFLGKLGYEFAEGILKAR